MLGINSSTPPAEEQHDQPEALVIMAVLKERDTTTPQSSTYEALQNLIQTTVNAYITNTPGFKEALVRDTAAQLIAQGECGVANDRSDDKFSLIEKKLLTPAFRKKLDLVHKSDLDPEIKRKMVGAIHQSNLRFKNKLREEFTGETSCSCFCRC
jgi:hypothetical protein